MSARAARLAVAVASASLLAACGIGPRGSSDGSDGSAGSAGAPGWEPSLTPSAASDWPPDSVLDVPEPSPPVPEGPPVKAHVRAYLRYLFDEVDYALRTTYVDNVLRTGVCSVCDRVIEMAEDAREERLRYEHEDWGGFILGTRRVPARLPSDTATYWAVEVMMWQPEIRTLSEDGTLLRTAPPRTYLTTFVIGQRDRSWRLIEEGDLDLPPEAAPA